MNTQKILSRAVRACVALLLILAIAAPAAAQSNSLFKRGRPASHGAATSQPAGSGQRASGDLRMRGAAPSADTPPPANPALLETSIIAVQPPPPRKVQVHDLITIIVREDKRAQTDAKLESSKDWKVNSELSKWFKLSEDDNLIPQNFANGTPGAKFDFKNEYDGEGKVNRKDSLLTRITAEVIDVKPNGTLILEAKKTIEMDEETQVLTLTGVCRSDDITADNTVLSTQLADAHIRVEHSGAARDAARRGWLMRAFDFLRPI